MKVWRPLIVALVGLALPPLVPAVLAGPPADLDPARMVRAVRRAHVLEGRRLENVREVCRLSIAGRTYPVLATLERMTGIPEPRLYRRLLVLRPDLSKASAIPYDLGVKPRRCEGDRVVFKGGTVLVNGQEGAVVQFANGGGDAWIAAERP